MMRRLEVSIDQMPVGTLCEKDDLWVLEYDQAWAEAAQTFDLAPGLPRSRSRHADGGTHRPVQWYFDNLLPEERLRQAISREAGIRGEDAFALLGYLGAESAGSLTLLLPGKELPAPGGLRELTDEALSARIGKLPRSTLSADAPKRMSLAGAQHKLLVVKLGHQLYEPEGAAPSTHILKPSHPESNDYPGSVANEYVTMRLAASCGLQVPQVELRYVPEPVYIVERFDRRIETTGKGTDRKVVRRHIIDACQLLDRPRVFKHAGATLESLQEVIERTTNKVATRLQLFRWLVFNIVVGNDDCHLKNLSFFMGADGVRLAPHYDLLATSVWNTRAFADERETWPRGPMAFALPGATSFGQATARSVFEAGRALGLPHDTAARIVRDVLRKLPQALDREAATLQERHDGAPKAAKRFMATEARVVRVMKKVVVADMLARLRAAES